MIYKIVCIGPKNAGKTSICNYLADNGFDLFGDYVPTDVRILEFPVVVVDRSGKEVAVDIRLWDCGGDAVNDSYWPSFGWDVGGVVFVTSNSQPAESSDRLKSMVKYFHKQRRRPASHALILRNNVPGRGAAGFDSPDERLKVVNADLQSNPDSVREHFLEMITAIVNSGYKGQEVSKLVKPRDDKAES